MFTRSRFAGPSVLRQPAQRRLGRPRGGRRDLQERQRRHRAPRACANAREVVAGVAAALGCAAPGGADRLDRGDRPAVPDGAGPRRARPAAPPLPATTTPTPSPAAIMTTDTHPKVVAVDGVGARGVVGVAKGVGMIEPDMATLITLFFTDAAIVPAALDADLPAGDRPTFNCVSVDTDTSTIDTAIVLAPARPGRSTPTRSRLRCYAVRPSADQAWSPATARARRSCSRSRVDGARDGRAGEAGGEGDRQLAAGQDRRSRRRPELGPGGDGDRQVLRRRRHRRAGGRHPLRRAGGLPGPRRRDGLEALAAYMRGDKVRIHVTSAPARAATVWGCDLPTATSGSTPTTRPDGSGDPPARDVALPEGDAVLDLLGRVLRAG